MNIYMIQIILIESLLRMCWSDWQLEGPIRSVRTWKINISGWSKNDGNITLQPNGSRAKRPTWQWCRRITRRKWIEVNWFNTACACDLLSEFTWQHLDSDFKTTFEGMSTKKFGERFRASEASEASALVSVWHTWRCLREQSWEFHLLFKLTRWRVTELPLSSPTGSMAQPNTAPLRSNMQTFEENPPLRSNFKLRATTSTSVLPNVNEPRASYPRAPNMSLAPNIFDKDSPRRTSAQTFPEKSMEMCVVSS